MRREFTQLPLLMLVGVIAGCGGRTEGLRILDQMRSDGLIEDSFAGDVRPSAAGSDRTQFAWPAEEALTVTAILKAADRLNPEIAAARARVGVVGGRAWQDSFYPNPSLDLESENVRPSNGGFGVSETTIGISQPIIIGDRRDAALATGEARVNAERMELEAVRRRVHGAIRLELSEAAYLREAIVRHGQLQSIAERTLEIARLRFDARAAPESEAIRARVEFNSLGIAIDRLQGDMEVSRERLVALLGGQDVALTRIILDPEPTHQALPPLEQLTSIIRSAHPAVLAAQARINAAQHEVDLERARRRSDVTARVGVGINHLDDQGFVEAGLGIPLPIFDGNDGSILAARFAVIERRDQAAAVVAELVGHLSETYRRWESAVRRLATFEEQVLSDAQRAYQQAETGYEAGKLQFVDMLDAQRTLMEAHLSQLELKRAVRRSRAEMSAVLGGTEPLDTSIGESP